MRIAVIYKQHSQGCAPTYTIDALKRMGHEVIRMNEDEYVEAGRSPEHYDLFFCQDSGEGIDFHRVTHKALNKTSMWYWDSAWNWSQRKQWGVGDDDMAKIVMDNGGWVFHAWDVDMDRCKRNTGGDRMSWLPVAGDPVRWPDRPVEVKIHKLSMVGNIYDGGRGRAVQYARDNAELHWPGAMQAHFEDAARIYRQSLAVFHPPTFFELPHDYTHERVDLMQGATMRHYEAMCCGVPLVTTPKYDFEKLGFVEGKHYFAWNTLDEIQVASEKAAAAYAVGGLAYADELREFAVSRHTYEHRMKTAFDTLRQHGVLNA